MRRRIQARSLRRPQSFGSSPMMEGAVPKPQRTINEMFGAAVPATKQLEVKDEDHAAQAIDVTEPIASPDFGPQVIMEMRKMWEAMYFVC